jgi:predicted dehydrogenase
MRRRWNSDPAIGGGGVLIDNGTHSIDVVRYLLGPIRRVFAFAGTPSAELKVEDTVNFSFITASEVMGTIHLSWNISQDRSTYVELCGTEGALKVGWQESAYQNNGHPQWVRFGVGYDKVAAFVNQVMNFVETIRGSAEPLITAEDGVQSVLAVEAAYRSMQTGQWVEVEERSSTPAITVAK